METIDGAISSRIDFVMDRVWVGRHVYDSCANRRIQYLGKCFLRVPFVAPRRHVWSDLRNHHGVVAANNQLQILSFDNSQECTDLLQVHAEVNQIAR